MSLREGFLASQRNLPLASTYGSTQPTATSAIKSLNQELQNILQQSNTYFSLGQIEKMIQLTDEGLRKYPNTKELYFNKGYGLSKLGQKEAALDCYQKALSIDPEFSSPLNNMGLFYLKDGNIDRAMELFQRATVGKPQIEDAWLNYAIALTKKNKKREAAQVLGSMIEKFPNNKLGPLYKGHIHREFREIQDAVGSYNKVLAIDPKNRDALLSLAMISTDMQHQGESAEYFRRLVEAHPNDAEVHKMNGYTLRQFGQTDRSIAAFKTALILDPNCVQTMIEQANNYLDKGEAQSALELYNRILQIDPRNKESLILKASILADGTNDENGDLTARNIAEAKKREALNCLDNALSIDPNNSDAYLLKGFIQKSMNDSEAAISNLSRAVSLNNNCTIGLMARGALFWKARQVQAAKDDMERLGHLVFRSANGSGQNFQPGPQDEAIQHFLAFYQQSEANLNNYRKTRQDLNRYGQIQANNAQKVLFLHAQNFEKKSKDDYYRFNESMQKLDEVNQRNFKLATAVMPPSPSQSSSPIEQYRTAFYCASEIVFEHFRDIYLTIEDPGSDELRKPLAFIDLPTYAQEVVQKFDNINGSAINEATLKERSISLYSKFRDHSGIGNYQEETRRYLMFFTGRQPADIEDFTMVNFQRILAIIVSSREHQLRVERAASHPDVIEFKRGNFNTKIDDFVHQDFFNDMRSDFQILGLNDALLVRSLMIFYRFKTELQYSTSSHDEIARFLLDHNILFSKSFQFDKVGGSIISMSNQLAANAHSLERPIMMIDADPDRILNYVEITKIKFYLHKNYTPFSTNEIVFSFKDYPGQNYTYKLQNGTEMPLTGLVFSQRKRTTVEMSITINRDHKRLAVVSFANLLEDAVWVVTEVFKLKPSKNPKSLVKLFFVKRPL